MAGPVAKLYAIDTSSLIEGWQFTYPPDVFPGVWTQLQELAESGRLIASEEVLHELKRKADALYAWARGLKAMFVPHDEEIQKAVREILKDHRNLLNSKKGKSGADPFVVAVAVVKKCDVVTHERRTGDLKNHPKIPDVCDVLGIRYLSLTTLLREQGLVLERRQERAAPLKETSQASLSKVESKER